VNPRHPASRRLVTLGPEALSEAELLNRRKEIETIVSSPRFLAAVATGDRATISQEAPSYVSHSGADLLAVFDENGVLMYTNDSAGIAALGDVTELLVDSAKLNQPGFVQNGNELYRVLGSPVVTADGFLLGFLALGHTVQSDMPTELNRLTGFDVIITHRHRIVGSSDSPLTRRFLSQVDADGITAVETRRAGTIEINGERILYHTVPQEEIGVTFIAPVDQHIAPIMKSVSTILIGIALVIGFLSMVVIYAFTHRRIGNQVDLLVNAAKRIAADDLEFTIAPASSDELGYLASEFERTRARILENRRQLKEAHESRVKSERLATVGRLTAGIVHDIKNPMAIIGGNAEMIQRTHEHDESYQQAGIGLNVDTSKPLVVRIDPHRFRRVVDNLLNNAREALKPGSSVSIRWQERDQDFVLIVRDTGPGIPPRILDTLFEPFVTHGKETGTGLGLAITKQIVEDHGGTIEAESIEGEGTTFVIRLPNAVLRYKKTPAAQFNRG